MKYVTPMNILKGLGLAGFLFTLFAYALLSMTGIVMVNIMDDYNSGNYTKFKQDVTMNNPVPTQENVNAWHIASPIMHYGIWFIFAAMIIMFFYIVLFSKFQKPKVNNPFKKSSWTKSQEGKQE